MADLFVSYASENRVKVATLVRLFEKAGWTAWWDRGIEGGRQWRKEIDDELAKARCVIVLWSRASVTKEWVINEARIGRERQVLLPVLLEPVEPPKELAEIQACRLTAWLGEETSFELAPLLHQISKKIGGSPPSVDATAISESAMQMTRADVMEATLEFCAARLEFFRRKQRGEAIPEDVVKSLQITYDQLCRALSPISSDDIHALIARFESAFTP